MLTRRIIPCLDVKNGKVVKGTQFRNHEIVGDILDLTRRYCDAGADELVFYDISASAEARCVEREWVAAVARELDIPFCVAGGIRSVADARIVLNAGADKVSVNSPALQEPALITRLAREFGSQCVVVGIDSWREATGFRVYQYTGDEARTKRTGRDTMQWATEAMERGAGEIVLNAMRQDGMKTGYDIAQLQAVQSVITVPLIASGGAGAVGHFLDVFRTTAVGGALAAGVFHRGELTIPALKSELRAAGIAVRP